MSSRCPRPRSLLPMPVVAVWLAATLGARADGADPAGPRVFLLDGNELQRTRRGLSAGDRQLAPAWAKLEREAQEALSAGPFSVTAKTVTPPGGDKHDYMSQAPYWWPDPKAPGGLPYIRRDGEINPERNKITDQHHMSRLASCVQTLALAYYFKGDEAYAARATQLLRTFFIDPGTRMNPNLQYGQFIPGVNTGRASGVIETYSLRLVVDAVGLLRGSKSLGPADEQGLKKWFGAYLRWLHGSAIGREEGESKSNHGTAYDIQVASFALFLGQTDLARKTVEAAKQKRIAVQVEPDGRQALELLRTQAFGYSVGNLQELMALARLGEHVNVDLWGFTTRDGRSIRRAFDFLSPFAVGDKKWPYPEIHGFNGPELFPAMRRAALRYKDQPFTAWLAKVPAADPAERSRLVGGSSQ